MARARKGTPGGRRQHSGRPTFFRGKSATADNPIYKNLVPARSILLTPEGHTQLNKTKLRLTREYRHKTGNKKANISYNVVVEGLVRRYAEHLTLQQIEQEDAHDAGR